MTIVSEIYDNQQILSTDRPEEESVLGSERPINSVSVIEDIPATKPALKGLVSFQKDETLRFVFNSQPRPWFSPALLRKLDKIGKGVLKREEFVDLIEQIAEICADFYQIEPGRVIAVKFDGHIVESADTEIDLLLKIQGKKFDVPIFVWKVGSESFSGWRT